MQNILVTGAAGFIGSKLVEELVKQHHRVYALIEKGDAKSRDKLVSIDSNIEIIDDSEQMYQNAANFPKFDRIFHLATVGVRPDFNDISLICDVNIKMGCKLVDFAKENQSGVLVNFGSCFEYGDHGEVLLTEDMDCHPESLYAISKNASTNLVADYAKTQNVNMITVRPFGVFGEGEGPTRLAPSIIACCLKGEKVKTTPGEQIRDFVNVKDLVKAIIRLSESEYKPYEIYNICSDNPVSVRDFILEIVDVCGFDVSLVDFGSISGLPFCNGERVSIQVHGERLGNILQPKGKEHHKINRGNGVSVCP